MKRLTALIFFICACATAGQKTKEPVKQPESEKPAPGVFALPKQDEYLNLQFRYSPRLNELLLISPDRQDGWEVLEISLSDGERKRYTLKGKDINLKNVVAVEGPFDWERLVDRVCELHSLRGKEFREGMLLISNYMCEDEFNFK